MSTIVITIKAEQPSMELIRGLRALTQRSLAEIRTALATNAPIIEARLHYNDHEEQAAKLRAMVSLIQQTNSVAIVYEVDFDKVFDPNVDDRIDLSSILEILDERDQSMQRMNELKALGHS